jgi:hypothetical protein
MEKLMTSYEIEILDSDGNKASFKNGDRVYVRCVDSSGVVVRQRLQYDGEESFWGNVIVDFGDSTAEFNSWQVEKDDTK